jgi:hypothetical protein
MKNYRILLAAFLLYLFPSCEKVINVDLKSAAPKIVIEGIVDNSGKPAKVIISKSVAFSVGNTYPAVTGATVKITDNTNNVFTLTETAPGIYTNAPLLGVVGKTYSLYVLAEGKTYTAISKMQRTVPLDTLIQESISLGTETQKIVDAYYTDPVGFGDNSQIVQTINGKNDKSVHVADDSFSDGSSAPFQIFGSTTKLKAGDVVNVELRFIDKNVYRYFKGIADLQDGNTVPADPTTNISGNPLGYFSAHTTQTKTIVIR